MYIPTQNGIKRSVRAVRYTEASPPNDLASLVHCFWELKTTEPLPDDFYYHVLPDACVDIVFDLTAQSLATIMTPHTTSATLNLGRSFHYIGVRFLPGVWRGEIKSIVGGYIDVGQLGDWPLSEIYAQLNRQAFTRQQLILAKISRHLNSKNLALPCKVTAAIISQLDDINSVADMADVAGVSTRQLQRIMKQTTGFSPHDFLKVIRLQQSFGRDYLDSYTDQSHFIHSFRKVTGYTPQKYAKIFNV